MGWLSTLKDSLHHKKRSQRDLITTTCDVTSMDEDDEPGSLVAPSSAGSDDEFTSRPKRRSVSVDINTPWTSRASTDSRRQSMDRRTSLELWQEARRQRNSTDYAPGGTICTDKLTVCKAGHTMVVNKTYITIKHLGSGTFGRVMLCFNMYDQHLYAIKACRKSQFVAQLSRYSHGSRLRRGSHFSPSPTSTCGMRSGSGLPQGAFSSGTGSGGPSPRLSGSYAGGGAFGSAFPGSSFSGGAAFGGVFGSGTASNGASSNGHISNGHVSNGHGSTGHGSNCHVTHGGMPNGNAFQDAVTRFQTDDLVKEIAILKKLSHPNIVNLVEVIDDPTTDSLLLVMEYVEGGTLEPAEISKGMWERVPEQEVWMYVREVLQGMDYLHYNKVVHGDLKPANLLLDSNGRKVKIADFGSSIMAGSDKCFSRNYPGFSTPAFRSPESLISGYQPSYEMDMWALGVCIYMWVFGHLPFTGAAPFIIYEKIRSQDIQLPDGENGGLQPISAELRDFIMQLLEKDVLKRLDVVAAMHHPWVTLSGAAPLASLREQQFAASVAMEGAHSAGGVPKAPLSRAPSGMVSISQEDMDAAIRQMDGSTAQCVDQVFVEAHFCDGQELVSAGDSANKIFLIASGEVEILADASGSTPGSSLDCGTREVSTSGLISGFELEVGDAHDGDMFDVRVSDMAASSGARDLLLEDIDRRRATHEQARTFRVGEPPKKLIAVKGPGDSLGPPFVQQRASMSGSLRNGITSVATDHRWRVYVRARGPVTAFRARLEDLVKLVEQHPEMEGAMKQMGTAQETDMMVAEAMRQLRLLNDCARPVVVDTAMVVSG